VAVAWLAPEDEEEVEDAEEVEVQLAEVPAVPPMGRHIVGDDGCSSSIDAISGSAGPFPLPPSPPSSSSSSSLMLRCEACLEGVAQPDLLSLPLRNNSSSDLGSSWWEPQGEDSLTSPALGADVAAACGCEAATIEVASPPPPRTPSPRSGARFETPREAAARRKLEAADRELARIAEATVLHVVNQPVRRRPVPASGTDYNPASPAASVELTPSPKAVPWPLRGADENEWGQKGSPWSQGSAILARASRSGGCDGGPNETPREAAQRRRREASDVALERLKEEQAEVAGGASQIGLQIRDSHTKAFSTPFATANGLKQVPEHGAIATVHDDGSGGWEDLGQLTAGRCMAELPGHSVLTPCRDGELGSRSTFLRLEEGEECFPARRIEPPTFAARSYDRMCVGRGAQ